MGQLANYILPPSALNFRAGATPVCKNRVQNEHQLKKNRPEPAWLPLSSRISRAARKKFT